MIPAFRWTGEEVSEALGLGARPTELSFTQVSTDTRSLEAGALFVALRGERFDGHDFLTQALERGARGVVVEDPPQAPGEAAVFQVPDTLVALGQLARHRRRRLGWFVVGVTGSVGKTTVKELLKAALRPRFRVHVSRANENNRVGVPFTLLEAPEASEVVVVEMGTNEPGEIGMLTGIAEPGGGVLTTVGEAHLEGLDSVEGVLQEKLDLLRGLPDEGWAVVGDEPLELPERARAIIEDVTVTGLSHRADPEFRVESHTLAPHGGARFRWMGREATLRLPGPSGLRNALLALAVARRLDVAPEAALAAVSQVRSPSLRGEIQELGGLTVVVDCYNANPQSMRAALDLLEALPAPGGRVAVLGSMLELGKATRELHLTLLQELQDRSLRTVVLVGTEFQEAWEGRSSDFSDRPSGPRLLFVPTVDEAEPILDRELQGREVVLLKGSRGLELERLLPSLEAHGGKAGGTVGQGGG